MPGELASHSSIISPSEEALRLLSVVGTQRLDVPG